MTEQPSPDDLSVADIYGASWEERMSGWGNEPAGQVSGDLAKAERWIQQCVRAVPMSYPQLLIDELARLRLVEQAAREVVRHFNTDPEMSRNFGLDERISNLEDALSTERT